MKGSPPWHDEESVLAALHDGRGEGVKIAVLDSGIEFAHPALSGGKFDDDWRIAEQDGVVRALPGKGEDIFGHGTAIAGIIHKLAPDASIGSFQVLNPGLGARNRLIRSGALFAIERGFQILNCSFGCRDDGGRHMLTYKQWVDEAYRRHVHLVTACNNEDADIQEWPGSFYSSLNVEQLSELNESWAYRANRMVEFAAGSMGELPWRDGGYRNVSGSSFAAPIVSAYLARLIGRFPDLTVVQAKGLLQKHARILTETT
ncbi:S8 family serine peptidase [Haloferula sp.]|uniref:S8 family serine peptidase n=1 Tax=Haloferula sp. TaxID=2497595 RepID=UPI00329C2EB2